MASTGYSGKGLGQKLGIKSWSRVKTRNAPAHYLQLLGELPADAQVSARIRKPVDFVHLFAIARATRHRTEAGARRHRAGWRGLGVVAEEVLGSQDGSDGGRDPRSGTTDGTGGHQGVCGGRDLVGAEAGNPEGKPTNVVSGLSRTSRKLRSVKCRKTRMS